MTRLERELFELFADSDFRYRKNKHGNYEIVLSPEAAEHLAEMLHTFDHDAPEGWGKL